MSTTVIESRQVLWSSAMLGRCTLLRKTIQTLILTRAILYDEKFYSQPELFNPDRFMKDGKINPDVFDPMTVAFGFGRR